MKITIICEGKTEKAFNPCLKSFLSDRLPGKNPKLRYDVHDGAIPSGKKLKKLVDTLLATGPVKSDAVVALTDVYPAFPNAAVAKDAGRILQDADLMTAINACPELKAFINTILRLCDKSKVIP